MSNGLIKHVTNDRRVLVEQLIYEFAKKCNYVLNKSLETQLRKFVDGAAFICEDMKVDPETYMAAQLAYAPVLRGQASLTPQQLCSKDSRIYVADYIASKGDRHVDREFETECRMLAKCINSGWEERLALGNPTLDFSPWFRILLRAERDEHIIQQFGKLASQILNNDKELVNYLKTIRASSGQGLDFSRIPDFKL